jgi:hypothetical protein
VTIFGDGFQDPVQVLFGTAEAHVLTVQFDRILVETPAGRDTNPDGSGTVTGPVTVTVRNINSQTEASMASGFHYKAAIQITGGSTNATTRGGGRVTIEGTGSSSGHRGHDTAGRHRLESIRDRHQDRRLNPDHPENAPRISRDRSRSPTSKRDKLPVRPHARDLKPSIVGINRPTSREPTLRSL